MFFHKRWENLHSYLMSLLRRLRLIAESKEASRRTTIIQRRISLSKPSAMATHFLRQTRVSLLEESKVDSEILKSSHDPSHEHPDRPGAKPTQLVSLVPPRQLRRNRSLDEALSYLVGLAEVEKLRAWQSHGRPQ